MHSGRRRGKLHLAFYILIILSLCFTSLVLSNFQFDVDSRKLQSIELSLRGRFGSSNSQRIVANASKERDEKFGSETYKAASQQGRNLNHPNTPLAGLQCEASINEIAKELVYWEDIPSDNRYVSPFKKDGKTKYVTFQPDCAGWNNKRMSLETVLAMAIAMGRTLVLPPKQSFYMLSEQTGKNGQRQRSQFSFGDFFPLKKIALEHAGLDVITTEEFLEREAVSGNIRTKGGSVSFPPGNRTNWDGAQLDDLKSWLRETMYTPNWEPNMCMAAFPASADPKDFEALKQMKESIDQGGGFKPYTTFVGKQVPVSAPAADRLKENWAGRKHLCMYDTEMQNAHVIHFPHNKEVPGSRMLVHFYAFLFFQDWRSDLWMKRFMRDHVRYNDHIQCAAARVIGALRDRARARGYPDGSFDSFHVRRGDFAYFYNSTLYDAGRIYNISKSKLRENATVFIATSVRDRGFFDPLRKHYDVVFLDDFLPLLEGVNTNFYGMIDQLVASRGRVFFGCWLSSFTGYINRLRGYHSNRAKTPGYEDGVIPSWYYATEEHLNDMRTYFPVHQAFFKREFATSWRLINTGVDEQQIFQSES